MEIEEFRNRLHEYQKYIDSSMFVNTFIDAAHQHGDNLELILQDMETGKTKYQGKLNGAKSL